MRILRLAELFVLKHATASSSDLENSVRADIHMLWQYPNKFHNILKACAEADAKGAKTSDEVKAVEGFKFCQEILSMVDYIQANRDKIGVGELREVLLRLVQMIKDHMRASFDMNGKISEKGEKSAVQFPHVQELIFQMFPSSKKNERKIRDEQYNKAKTGLSRIMSLASTMIDKLSKLEMIAPEKFTHVLPNDVDVKVPDRFIPQRGILSIYDIVDFIRQHGDEYGIPTTEDWGTVFTNDPQLKEQMTTVINAINRGHAPRDAANVKAEIANILKGFNARKSLSYT